LSICFYGTRDSPPQIIKRWLNLVTLKNSHSLYCSNYIADLTESFEYVFLLSFMQTLPSPFLSIIRCMSLSLSSFVFSRMLQTYSSVSEHSYRNSQFHVLTHVLFLFICELLLWNSEKYCKEPRKC
jgi:hypothetical protein